jgi:hypothetical protein
MILMVTYVIIFISMSLINVEVIYYNYILISFNLFVFTEQVEVQKFTYMGIYKRLGRGVKEECLTSPCHTMCEHV